MQASVCQRCQSRWLLVLLVVITLAAPLGCGGSAEVSSGHQPISNLTADERNRLAELSRTLREKAETEPAVPVYIPDGLARYPQLTGSSGDGFFLEFQRSANDTPTSVRPRVLDLIEDYDPDHLIVDDPALATNCGIVPGLLGSPQCLSYRGTSIRTTTGPQEQDAVSYSLDFRYRDLGIHLRIDWEGPPGSGTPAVSDSMKQESLDVLDSILDQ